MAAIDWPSTLPVARDGTLLESNLDPFVSDQAQIGAPRRRKRFTRALRRFSFTMVLTAAQVSTLRTFVDTTTDSGVHEFNWPHPVTAVTYEVRFQTLPEFRHLTAGDYEASISLEEI